MPPAPPAAIFLGAGVLHSWAISANISRVGRKSADMESERLGGAPLLVDERWVGRDRSRVVCGLFAESQVRGTGRQWDASLGGRDVESADCEGRGFWAHPCRRSARKTRSGRFVARRSHRNGSVMRGRGAGADSGRDEFACREARASRCISHERDSLEFQGEV